MGETTSHHASRPSGFLRLPLELREEIYDLLLVRRGSIEVQSLHFEVESWIRSVWENPEELNFYSEDCLPRRKTGILCVSRQISEEALNVLYGRNRFNVTIHGGAHTYLLKIDSANRRRIRRLCLVAQPMGVDYGTPLKFEPELWLPLLADLRQLCIVAQQPLQAGGYYNAPSLEQDMKEWTSWLEPILQYLGKNVAKTTIVEIDDDEKAETSGLMKKCFPLGYKMVRTVVGDRCFMRGEFSLESGYWDYSNDGCNFADGGMGDDWSD